MLTRETTIKTPSTPVVTLSKISSTSDYRRSGRTALQHLDELRNQSSELLTIPSIGKEKDPGEIRTAHSMYMDPNWSSYVGSPVAIKKWVSELPTPVYFEDWPSPSPKRQKLDMDSLFPSVVAGTMSEWDNDDHDQKISSTQAPAQNMDRTIQDQIHVLDRELLSRPSMTHLRQEDMEKLGAFHFYVVKQFHPCTFTRTELKARRNGRHESPTDLKYVGFKCVHCVRKKYLWLTKDTFKTTNSLNRLAAHAMKCASSKKIIRDALRSLDDMPIVRKKGRSAILSRLWDNIVEKVNDQTDTTTLSDEIPPEAPADASESSTSESGVYELEGQTELASQNPSVLLYPEDMDLLTPFVFRCMNFLERCTFFDKDDNRRSVIPKGFSGLRCTFCVKRCFFWTSPDRFTNSFSDVTKHVRTCRGCPSDIREELDRLCKNHQGDMKNLPRGAQAVFFRRLWARLHSSDVIGTEIVSDSRTDS
jgi:hypothetical protein